MILVNLATVGPALPSYPIRLRKFQLTCSCKQTNMALAAAAARDLEAQNSGPESRASTICSIIHCCLTILFFLVTTAFIIHVIVTSLQSRIAHQDIPTAFHWRRRSIATITPSSSSSSPDPLSQLFFTSPQTIRRLALLLLPPQTPRTSPVSPAHAQALSPNCLTSPTFLLPPTPVTLSALAWPLHCCSCSWPLPGPLISPGDADELLRPAPAPVLLEVEVMFPVMGSTLSPALRLTNSAIGTSQTKTAKKVLTSVREGETLLLLLWSAE